MSDKIFFFYMLIIILLIPIILIIFGAVFIKRPPKKINGLYGYRTVMSMKNQDTWSYAQNYFGLRALITGIIMIVPSVIVIMLISVKNKDTIGIAGCVITLLQCVSIIIPVILTERALRRTFDRNGLRR